MSQLQWWGLGSLVVLLVGLVTAVTLVQQPQLLQKKAAGGQAVLLCDPGPDPYQSRSITVTNNSTETINDLNMSVFRCTYVPNMISQNKGRFRCDDSCTVGSPGCLRGTRDSAVSRDGIVMTPGQSQTFTVTVDPCQIVQLDIFNEDIHVEDHPTECHNVQSQYTVQPGEVFPGGFAFAIDENPTGYDTSSGSCPTATNTPAPTSAPQPTSTPQPPTSTPQPTAPPGQPSYTPIPTAYVTSPPTQPPVYYPTSTPMPTRPVSGAGKVTAIGILGAVGLLIISVL